MSRTKGLTAAQQRARWAARKIRLRLLDQIAAKKEAIERRISSGQTGEALRLQMEVRYLSAHLERVEKEIDGQA